MSSPLWSACDSSRPAGEGCGRLTERQREVLGPVAAGLSAAEIAARLVLGVETAKTHVAGVLDELGVPDRVQAVVPAHESGPVQAGGSRSEG